MKSDRSPGKVVTFYSYKGGTGRSMALANVAWILASNGQRVLVIDWDLEAPGLHRYFSPFLVDQDLNSSQGVIDFILEYALEAMTPPSANMEPKKNWYTPYTDIIRYAISLDWDFPQEGSLDFIPAGRQTPLYSSRVNSFNWQDFYDRLGGKPFLQMMKAQMCLEYDYILIDSRTGASDTSGICTVELPDVLIICYTLNNQSIEGAAGVGVSVQKQRPDLKIISVPMRIDLAEKDKLDYRQMVAKLRFSEINIESPERLQFAYIPYYAYEEILSTFGDVPNKPNTFLDSSELLTAEITEGRFSRLQQSTESLRRDEILAAYKSRVDFAVANHSEITRLTFYDQIKRIAKVLSAHYIGMTILLFLTTLLLILPVLPRLTEKALTSSEPYIFSFAGEPNVEINDLWLTDNGDLLVVTDSESSQNKKLIVFRLEDDKIDVVRRVSIDLERTAKSCGGGDLLPSNERRVYALSRDGRRIGVPVSNGVCVAPLDEGRAVRIEAAKQPISSLGFLGTTGDALGVVFEDGLFNIYDVETQNKKPARSRFGKGMKLRSVYADTLIGFYLTSGSQVGRCACIRYSKQDRMTTFLSNPSDRVSDFSYAVTGGCEKIAIGQSDGSIIISSTSDHISSAIFLSPGEVRSLAYSEEGSLFAGGNFSGIYVLENGVLGARKLLATAPDVKLLAVKSGNLIYAMRNRIFVAKLERQFRFTSAGILLISGLLVSFSVLTYTLFLSSRGVKRRTRT